MKIFYILRQAVVFGVALTLSCGTVISYAADTPSIKDIIDSRQQGFKKMGSAMKVFRTQLREDNPDTTAMSDAAKSIALYANDVSGWFPEGTGMDSGFDTDALNYIWKNPTKFNGYSQDLIKASNQLIEAVSSADNDLIKTAIIAVKDSCSDCHSSFRAD